MAFLAEKQDWDQLDAAIAKSTHAQEIPREKVRQAAAGPSRMLSWPGTRTRGDVLQREAPSMPGRMVSPWDSRLFGRPRQVSGPGMQAPAVGHGHGLTYRKSCKL